MLINLDNREFQVCSSPEFWVRITQTFLLADHHAAWTYLGVYASSSDFKHLFSRALSAFFDRVYSQDTPFFAVARYVELYERQKAGEDNLLRARTSSGAAVTQSSTEQLEIFLASLTGKRLKHPPLIGYNLPLSQQQQMFTVPPLLHNIFFVLKTNLENMLHTVIPKDSPSRGELVSHLASANAANQTGKLSASAASFRKMAFR